MQVLARGTSEARIAAANLLFHYWPIYSGQILQRRPIQYRVQGLLCDCLFIILAKYYNLPIYFSVNVIFFNANSFFSAWNCSPCQNPNCPEKGPRYGPFFSFSSIWFSLKFSFFFLNNNFESQFPKFSMPKIFAYQIIRWNFFFFSYVLICIES